MFTSLLHLENTRNTSQFFNAIIWVLLSLLQCKTLLNFNFYSRVSKSDELEGAIQKRNLGIFSILLNEHCLNQEAVINVELLLKMCSINILGQNMVNSSTASIFRLDNLPLIPNVSAVEMEFWYR